MELGSYSEDRLDQLIAGGERQIASIRLIQMAAIAEKRRRRSHLQDGYRTIVDWTAARADVSHETARDLCWTATRLGDASEVAEQLASGEISFDRAEQLARLPEEHRPGHEGYDISGLRRLVAHHKRLTRKRERKTGNGYLHFGHADELGTSYWGGLPGLDARIMEKAVDQKADEIIPTDQRLSVAERRALALVAICQESLYRSEVEPAGLVSPEILVTVDAKTAVTTGGETGVGVVGGSRLGPSLLEEILCHGMIGVVGIDDQGKPHRYGKREKNIPEWLHRYVLARDGECVAEGCPFDYRLEVHHIRPRSHGGNHDPDNLITLCWFHHHVSVHREGLEIIRIGTSRVRLKRPR